ncbi:TIGR02679 domain-containing protein [Actinomadura hibisca]|uniref:TIGR02679 domain-containing protein n=1 Tax=Actinomadura hibisca TaxID=68565 RepID=UPI00082A315E|nr:TIGR02679 domain-containing protein [Actinomadura hibisca]
MTGGLVSLADDPDFAPFWRALHDRLCEKGSPEGIATLKVEGLSLYALAEIRTLLGATPRRRSPVGVSGTTTTIPLRALLKATGTSPQDLVALAEQVVGKNVESRLAVRQAEAGRRRTLWEHATVLLARFPRLVDRLKASGIGANEPEARRLVNALAQATGGLPYDPPVSLPKLAHDCAGDPHYFDPGTLNRARLIDAVAEFTDRADPTRPHQVHVLLAEVGIITDRLSATVLLHRVKTTGDGVIDRRLQDSVTPVALTLLDLTRNPPTLAPQTVTVVENPSLLEAAMARGSDVALVCTSGQLGAVDHVFLQLARDQGVTIRYAGDLDHHGFQIAATVADQYGAELIAMDAATVAEAAAASPAASAVSLLPQFDPMLKHTLGLAEHAVFQENDAVIRRVLAVGEPHET